MITCVSFFACLLCVALVNAKSNRIIGGDRATAGQIKYLVSLQVDDKNVCGGAIIADQYVLTAAHCVLNIHGQFNPWKYQVVAGSTNLWTNQGVRIDVEKIYVPKEFSPVDRSNDIAVLKLHRELDLDSNPNLQKVDLPWDRESALHYVTAVVSGYGYTYVDTRLNPETGRKEEISGHTDGKLRYVTAKIVNNQKCARIIYYLDIAENQICGQAVQRRGQPAGVCTGDSGGPLVSGNTIIGVATASPADCVEDQFPSLYTRVSSFLDFIADAMKDTNSRSMLVHKIHSGESSSGSKGKGKGLKWPFKNC